ncbi:Uncharacterized protein LHYA1_G003867 [Lachnellula hyalina]|uniref:Calcineurin-like phosphoesterase domain-containing protein n=1 Tax=Lachnellula hyalina TaxID=1316788 RepID=A0A8H8R314_9HELO|nr:Uncharacterized protein LHYA1_G003867 [Lachnellula hyalina]TVY27617.1 Uncharacterized protein LHYA1_G003867 [Lachnellula hyalina]
MSSVKIQLMSDLHLETPQARPTYQDFEIPPKCQYLALLGDIENIGDSRLFDFLEKQLRSFEVVFYLLGNHELFGMTRLEVQTSVRAFEHEMEELRSSLGSNQTRYDLTEKVTVLGCTLFSHISNDQQESVSLFCSDFSEIQDWTVDTHNAAHRSDLHWLDTQVEHITQHEPHRKILVFTHHSPTLLEDANNPRHLDDAAQVRSAFVTDLSEQECWKNASVKLWAFGHTHFNCDFVDSGTKRRVVANQKGYRRSELDTFDVTKVVEVIY